MDDRRNIIVEFSTDINPQDLPSLPRSFRATEYFFAEIERIYLEPVPPEIAYALENILDEYERKYTSNSELVWVLAEFVQMFATIREVERANSIETFGFFSKLLASELTQEEIYTITAHVYRYCSPTLFEIYCNLVSSLGNIPISEELADLEEFVATIVEPAIRLNPANSMLILRISEQLVAKDTRLDVINGYITQIEHNLQGITNVDENKKELAIRLRMYFNNLFQTKSQGVNLGYLQLFIATHVSNLV